MNTINTQIDVQAVLAG
jgi:hypothetical protein